MNEEQDHGAAALAIVFVCIVATLALFAALIVC
jgi:hypothetical protein